MRTRLFAASAAAALTVAALGVSAGPSNAQTPSTVFVGVVTVTNPAVAPVPPNPQVTGPRRTVSCRTYYRGHGKGRHVTKRKCRKRYVSDVSTRRTVQTVSVAQPTLVVPPPPTFTVAPPLPPPTFVVAPPPPTFVIAPPPPVIVVYVPGTPIVKYVDRDDHDSRRPKHEKKRKARDEGKERGSEKGKEKGKESSNSRGHDD